MPVRVRECLPMRTLQLLSEIDVLTFVGASIIGLMSTDQKEELISGGSGAATVEIFCSGLSQQAWAVGVEMQLPKAPFTITFE